MKNDSLLLSESYSFAMTVVVIAERLSSHHHYSLADQLLRSGTSVGANLREARFAQSKADFISKISISLKECNESEYWLDLLFDSNLISLEDYNLGKERCVKLKYMLISALKKQKNIT